MNPLRQFSTTEVMSFRPVVERPAPGETPLGLELELEPDGHGHLVGVATIFLRGAECSFKCTMCDLWKFTHVQPTPRGAIPAQIAATVQQLPPRWETHIPLPPPHTSTGRHSSPSIEGGQAANPARERGEEAPSRPRRAAGSENPRDVPPQGAGRGSGVTSRREELTDEEPHKRWVAPNECKRWVAPVEWIKLYNAANFFSATNVPPDDLPQIARLVRDRFARVIVENHPRLCHRGVELFQAALEGTRLEIATGLETVHPRLLRWLNKQAELEDFARAFAWLHRRGIDTRAFVLLGLPGLSRNEAVEWCVRSVAWALDHHCRHVSIIPLRATNGLLENLVTSGDLQLPTLDDIEAVTQRTLALRHEGRVVMTDPWDLDKVAGGCSHCRPLQRARFQGMNLAQRAWPAVHCSCTAAPSDPHGCV
ncbi:MAG: hypothetical protein KatS3mg111_0967 [Pirellulaceae bacterium]|nr:MAG: hypothetical protein KatS3mg111_0967 [Pirellulaceae bacterium]